MKPVTKGFDSSRSVRVALGLTLSGYLRIWHDDVPSLWKIARYADADELESLLCSGAVSTDTYDRAHYRESASLDRTTSMLCVGKTISFSHTGGTLGSGVFMKVTRAAEREARDGLWDHVEGFIIRAAEGAQARGEVLVVGPGPNPRTAGPAVLLSTSTTNARTYSVVSASPPPSAGTWGESVGVEERVTLMATLSPTARAEAASLAVSALREWGVAPFDVGIAFVVPIEMFTASSQEQ